MRSGTKACLLLAVFGMSNLQSLRQLGPNCRRSSIPRKWYQPKDQYYWRPLCRLGLVFELFLNYLKFLQSCSKLGNQAFFEQSYNQAFHGLYLFEYWWQTNQGPYWALLQPYYEENWQFYDLFSLMGFSWSHLGKLKLLLEFLASFMLKTCLLQSVSRFFHFCDRKNQQRHWSLSAPIWNLQSRTPD